jgi:hypothetical protein
MASWIGAVGSDPEVDLKTTGSVGIGTDPQEKVHLDGGASSTFVWFTNDATGRSANSAGLTFGVPGTKEFRIHQYESQPVDFMLGSDIVLRIEAGGNVGIGSSDPDKKLDVNGSVRVSSEYCVDGTRVLRNQAGAVDVIDDTSGEDTDKDGRDKVDDIIGALKAHGLIASS